MALFNINFSSALKRQLSNVNTNLNSTYQEYERRRAALEKEKEAEKAAFERSNPFGRYTPSQSLIRKQIALNNERSKNDTIYNQKLQEANKAKQEEAERQRQEMIGKTYNVYVAPSQDPQKIPITDLGSRKKYSIDVLSSIPDYALTPELVNAVQTRSGAISSDVRRQFSGKTGQLPQDYNQRVTEFNKTWENLPKEFRTKELYNSLFNNFGLNEVKTQQVNEIPIDPLESKEGRERHLNTLPLDEAKRYFGNLPANERQEFLSRMDKDKQWELLSSLHWRFRTDQERRQWEDMMVSRIPKSDKPVDTSGMVMPRSVSGSGTYRPPVQVKSVMPPTVVKPLAPVTTIPTGPVTVMPQDDSGGGTVSPTGRKIPIETEQEPTPIPPKQTEEKMKAIERAAEEVPKVNVPAESPVKATPISKPTGEPTVQPSIGTTNTNKPAVATPVSPSTPVSKPVSEPWKIYGGTASRGTTGQTGLLPSGFGSKMPEAQKQIMYSPRTQALMTELQKYQKEPTMPETTTTTSKEAIRRKLNLPSASASTSSIQLQNTPIQSKVEGTLPTRQIPERREVDITSAPVFGTSTLNKIQFPQTQELSQPLPQTPERREVSAPSSFSPVAPASQQRIVLPEVGTRDWRAIVGQQTGTGGDTLNLQREALKKRLESGGITPETIERLTAQPEAARPEFESFDIQRQQVEARYERELEKAKEQFAQQMATQGIMKGSGLYEQQMRDFEANARRELGTRLTDVNLAEAQAREARRETREGRIFEATQKELDRQLTRNIEQGRLDVQTAQLAQQASQFDNELAFKQWATEAGFAENEQQRAWQEVENAKEQAFQSQQNTLNRTLQRDIEQGKISQREAELALQASQFDNELAFKQWATQAGFQENERNRAWQEYQQANQQQHEIDVLGIEHRFKATSEELDRQLQRDIEQGRMDIQTAQLAQQASQFNDEMAFKEWATNVGLDDQEAQRAWQEGQNAQDRIMQEKLAISDQKFKQAMLSMENDLQMGRMDYQDQINDENLLRQTVADSYYKMGTIDSPENPQLTNEEIEKISKENPMYYAAYRAGQSAMAFDDYQREMDNYISYRNALISGLDPKDADFNKKLNQIAEATGMLPAGASATNL